MASQNYKDIFDIPILDNKYHYNRLDKILVFKKINV